MHATNTYPAKGCSQKSGEGGAFVLFDTARIKEGVLELLQHLYCMT